MRLKEIFQFDLYAYPPTFFYESGLMRKGSKYPMLWFQIQRNHNLPPDSDKVSYIIDGGHLLHNVGWRRPAIFRQICEQYTDYVITHYGQATFVFYGYKQGNAKDEEHLRRSCSTTNIEVKVDF